MSDLLEKNDGVTEDFPWVLFTLENVMYAVSGEHVLSIETLGKVNEILEAPDYIRGMTWVRDHMLALIDLRKLFHLPNSLRDLSDELETRIEQHKSWISSLERTVQTGEPFELALDPTQCAFGKWYYGFKTDNNMISNVLAKIEKPHRELHMGGRTIVDMISAGNQTEAIKHFQYLSNTVYKQTISHLTELVSLYNNALEMMIVLDLDGQTKGILVDEVVAVEYLDNTFQSAARDGRQKYVQKIGQRLQTKANVQVLNAFELVSL